MANQEFEKIVTVASRPPRHGEGEIEYGEEGWEYHSLKEGEGRGKVYQYVGERGFLKMVRRREFLEFTNYGKNDGDPDWKGTLKRSFMPVLQGKNIIWRIDMGAAAKIHQILLGEGADERYAAYFNPLTQEEYEQIADKIVVVVLWEEPVILRQRVKERDGDKFDQKKFDDRMAADMDVWLNNKFDHVVFNQSGQLDRTVAEIMEIVANKEDGMLLILAGPTGVGKDTIIDKILR